MFKWFGKHKSDATETPPATAPLADAVACKNKGNGFFAAGQLEEAARCYRQAIALNPNYAEAYNNLGLILQAQGQSQDAENTLKQAIAANPALVNAHYNLGNVLHDQERLDEAIASYRRALSLQPDYHNAYNGLGSVFHDQGDLGEAVACYQKALSLNPDDAEACNNLGNTYYECGEDAAASAQFARALELRPDYPDAYWNLAVALLRAGALAEGWERYEYRFRLKEKGIFLRAHTQPRWQGEPLVNKTILVWGEQGVGDEILFASLLPDFVPSARQVILECNPKLTTLFARSFPGVAVVPCAIPPHPGTQMPSIDFQTPAGSLARWLRPTLESFPNHSGYLVPDPARVAFWKNRLAALDGQLKVGISWRSQMLTSERRRHYSPLENWGRVLALPDVTFINLQYGECAAELAAVRHQFGVAIHDFDDVDLFNDLDEVAALTQALDVVVSPATSVAFMAGALGVPTFQFGLEFAYWESLGTDHFPWFPAMTLFNRQPDEGWERVFEDLARALVAYSNAKR